VPWFCASPAGALITDFLQSPPATCPLTFLVVTSLKMIPAIGLFTLVTSQNAGMKLWSSNLGSKRAVAPGSKSIENLPVESVNILGL
jgi:hypothetical protein